MNQVPPISSYTQGTGTSSSNQFIELFSERDPTPNDTQYPIQKRWFNVNTNSEWILVSFTTTNATLQANWQEITTASEAVLSISDGSSLATPNSSGIVTFGSTSSTVSISANGTTVNFGLTGVTPITAYTPALSSSANPGIISYITTPTGVYSVSNGICTCGFLVAASVSGTTSGALQVSLPLPATQQISFGIGRTSVNGTGTWQGYYQVQFGSSQCNIVSSTTGSQITLLSGNSYNLAATITYFVG